MDRNLFDTPDSPAQTPAPPRSDNDIGSPGMLGANSAVDVVHEIQPGISLHLNNSLLPPEDVQLQPPDIGGGD